MATSAITVLQFWKDLSFSRLQHELDTGAAEIAQRQDGTDNSRRKLIDLSREYKRTVPEEERKRAAPLLKSFQGEVDLLARRAKSAESSYLAFYKRLADAPDPAPALDQGSTLQKRLAALQDVEFENKKLRETLEQYNKEFAEVRNQEVTVSRLREKVKEYEDQMEETAKTRAQEKERQMQRHFAEKERELTNQQVELATKLGIAEQQTATLQSGLDNARQEILSLRTKNEELTEARSSELDMVSTDLERCQLRSQTAEREVEQLREQLSSARQAVKAGSVARSNAEGEMATDSGVSVQATLEAEVAAKDREVIRLVGDLQQLQSAMAKTRENSAAQISSLEEQLSARSHTLHDLERTLSAQDDYDEIRRELSILKLIEFPSSAARDNEFDDDDDESRESSKKPLEVLFLEKNKVLVAENTSLKLAQSESSVRVMELEQECVELRESSRRQKDLISQLEMDLINLQSLLPSRTEGEGQAADKVVSETARVMGGSGASIRPLSTSGAPPLLPSSPATLGVINSPTRSLLPLTPGPMGATAAGGGGGANDSLLPIVSSQRERFRQRNLELEAETRQLHQTIAVLRNEVDTLRSDNIKLYEKVKFLQSYSSGASSGGAGVGGSIVTHGDETVSRYSSQYEEKLDPFAAFGRREKQRKYMGLSAPERVTLGISHFVLSNKTARTVAFFYTLLLHLLTVLVLWKFAYTENCQRDANAECCRTYAKHMNLHHDHAPGNPMGVAAADALQQAIRGGK